MPSKQNCSRWRPNDSKKKVTSEMKWVNSGIKELSNKNKYLVIDFSLHTLSRKFPISVGNGQY